MSESENVEDRRTASDSRRSADRYEHGKFVIAILAFALTLLGGIWAVARSAATTQQAIERIASVDEKLTSIESKLNQVLLTDNSRAKDIEFLKQELATFKEDYKRDKQLTDTLISNTREQIIKINAKGQ